MTRIPGAIWTPATYDPAFPKGKYGYDGYKKTRKLSEILYVVYHDARGYRGYLRQGHRPGERASWLATVQTDGTILQHFELEHPTWTSGTYQANIDGVAVEHENEVGPWGVPQGTPTTDAQMQADAHIFLELRKVCPNLRAPVLGQGFEEHTRLTNGATSCPSGRIRWNDIATELEKSNVSLNVRLVGLNDGPDKGRVYADFGIYLVHVPGPEYIANWDKVEWLASNNSVFGKPAMLRDGR